MSYKTMIVMVRFASIPNVSAIDVACKFITVRPRILQRCPDLHFAKDSIGKFDNNVYGTITAMRFFTYIRHLKYGK